MEYFKTAKENELVFRGVLEDMKRNSNSLFSMRPGKFCIPRDLDTTSSLEDLFKKYSEGNRYGKFTITDFTVKDNEAVISFRDVAALSGGGSAWVYETKEGVKYKGNAGFFIS
ncbi:hypothetical protein HY837_02005 [archaeon]|nr:hypothetical protein [archaeon]